MSFALLLDLIHSQTDDSWGTRNSAAFDALFGSPNGRYRAKAKDKVRPRTPEMKGDSRVTFAAYIHPQNAGSGAYSGLSFVIFPAPGEPCMIGLVVGTAGLDPDQATLGRPGHARKAQAICAWLNHEYGNGTFVAWAKQDPTRTDISVPEIVRRSWPAYDGAFEKYGKVMYALYRPTGDRNGTIEALAAFLDLMFQEREEQPTAAFLSDADRVRGKWFEHLMPGVDRPSIAELLESRRYVIIQGPPGTGKTMMATDILRDQYGGCGRSIQFHPNTTYENFIGGLAPASTGGGLGFQFTPTPGALMETAAEALRDPSRNYLLHIDEINRSDLGKILGEAIFLLEPKSISERRITLPYDFGDPFHREFFLPKNLHILGTMNSADRSIAIVDVAVRRRFAFESLWPRMSIVDQYGCATMQRMFKELVAIFIEHAGEDAFPLVPGHSYFLELDEAQAIKSLRVNLAPLLEEYLAQGYVTGFAEPIRGYLQQIRSL